MYNGAMLAVVDVHYLPTHAFAACVLFHAFTDAHETDTRVVRVTDIAPYEPGAFYKRELPCLLAVLNTVGGGLETVVIDGYVWLSADGKPGLGARLFEAFDGRVAVVGVAKRAFAGASNGIPVLRGTSKVPLFVTAAGIDAKEAAARVAGMHGEHRIPTLLKRVDRLCRDAE